MPVIENIDFEVGAGEIVGLIGLNGAGKSTTLKHIMGLLRPFSGEVLLEGQKLLEDAKSYRNMIGYIPEAPSLYNELTLEEHLEVVKMAYQIPDQAYETRKRFLLEEFKLSDRLQQFPAYFSKGMKQKVMIVSAFLIEPQLYIIDEPFIGLDPLAIRSLIQLLEDKKDEGAAILMSTHVLSTAEKYCDRYVILHQGKVIGQGSLTELQEEFGLAEKSSLEDLYFKVTAGDSRD